MVTINVSLGELADKISILLIKREKFKNREKLDNVQKELDLLCPVLEKTTFSIQSELFARLKTVNEALWQIEDDIRLKEARQTFDADFIRLARSVYFKNDERSRIKREINEQFESGLIEEKEYSSY